MFNNQSSPQMPPVPPSGAPSSSSGYVASSPVSVPSSRSGDSSLLKTVIIILLSLLLVGAILLSYYFFREYRVARTTIDSQVASAVAKESKNIEDSLRAEYDEEEKSPYKSFGGPTDYGSLSFKYPKTWSAYVEKDASSGGDFVAYLHPDEVPPINDDNPIALTVEISTTPYDSFVSSYSRNVESGELTSSIIKINGQDATRLSGTFGREETGTLVLIKIRDKTASFWTKGDIYISDYNKILETITFNQ